MGLHCYSEIFEYNKTVGKLTILLLLLASISTFAEVLKFDVTGHKRELYSYKEVCESMGHRNLLIVEPKNVMHMDCMGSIVNIKEFCLTVSPKKSFLRGYINKKMNEVVCMRGKAAFLSMGCDKRDKSYCEKPQKGCQKLKQIYAYSHELDYHTLIEKDVDNVLNCYFQLRKEKVAQKKRFVIPGEEPPVIEPDLFSSKNVKKSDVKYLPSP